MALPSFVERPHEDDGWWAGYLGPIQVLHFGPQVNAAGFSRYVDFLASELDQLGERNRIGIMYDCPKPAMSNGDRQRVAKVLAERRERMRRSVLGYVMVTESLLVRSITQTVFFFSRPPYPTAVEASTMTGFKALAKWVPSFDPVATHAKYAEAHRTFMGVASSAA